jgi:hypothetical protein
VIASHIASLSIDSDAPPLSVGDDEPEVADEQPNLRSTTPSSDDCHSSERPMPFG